MAIVETLRGFRRHHLGTVLAAAIVGPALVLAGLGAWALQRDVRLEHQQAEVRRHLAADLAERQFRQSVADAWRAVTEPSMAAGPGEPHVRVTIDGDTVDVRARGALLYLPVRHQETESVHGALSQVDVLEYGSRDRAAAVAERVGRAHTGSTAALAWVRAARLRAQLGELPAAFAAYDRAAAAGGMITGVPSDLFARWARCRLLDASRRRADLQAAGAALHADLLAGRWPLTRDQFAMHEADARSWAGVSTWPAAAQRAARFSEALAIIHEQQRNGSAAARGEVVLPVQGRRVAVLWSRMGGQVSVLLTSAEDLEHAWTTPLRRLLAPHGLVATLQPGQHASAPAAVVRIADVEGSPWRLLVSATGTQRPATLGTRHRVWAGALVLLVAFSAFTAWAVTRAVVREVAAARLQTAFVAAAATPAALWAAQRLELEAEPGLRRV